MRAGPRIALLGALALLGCATPAQRAELMLKAFDEKCLDLPASALERGGRVDEVLPTGVLKVSGQAWRTEPAASPYLMSLHCELEGDAVDEALLARGLIARLRPPRDLHSRRPWEWSTTWPLDPLGGGAVASLSRRVGRTFLRVHASRLGDTRVTRAASTLREHLASWRELPGADEAYAARFDALLRGQEAERRLLARDAAIGRERMAQHRAERAEAQRKIIAGALVNAAGAAMRVAREVNQVEADTARIAAQSASNRASSGGGSTYAGGQPYSTLSAGAPYSGGGNWVPPPPKARKGKASPKDKPVCRWGQARDCPNGFKVGPVEYDCGKPSARGQAEANYQKQLAQCSEGVRTSGDVAQCFRERTSCLKDCEEQEACEEPPRPAAQEYLGPEPSKTEQGLWWVLQTEGVTSTNSLGWQPRRETAENIAVSSARSAAERECRARYEPELKPRLQPNITRFPVECTSKVEMGTTQWNCKAVVKATCEWERPSAQHAAWLEKKQRVEVSETERAALQTKFEQCKAAQKQASQSCKTRCQRCE